MSAGTPLYDGLTPTAAALFARTDLRETIGFLTPEEVAEWYAIALHVINQAVERAEVAAITFKCQDGSRAMFLPTHDAAVARWLEEHR